jgi:mannosyltransferase OCH1-like enzyme
MELIPKIIHYCWFGPGEMPELSKRCLESWNHYLPDYKIIEWNEESFDINSNLFVKQAYESKKYAFVADYVRLYALYHHGGIYLDTDVEVIKNLDCFLTHPVFIGFENINFIGTATIGSIQGHPWIRRLLEYYKNRSFIKENGTMDLTTNVFTISEICDKEFNWKRDNNFQILKDGVHIYPNDYFCPKDYFTSNITLTKNSHTIHHFEGSWLKNH